MGIKESELKFVCAGHFLPIIQQGVESVCQADDSFQENQINSVYFDTHDWLFAMEKASSDFLKTKIRLRWYRSTRKEDANKASPCFLEFKNKIGSKREKARIEMPFTGEQVLDSIQSNEVQDLIDSHIQHHVPLFANHQISPKFIVQYKRNRYFEPFTRTRISLDREIQGHSVDNSAIFSASSTKLDDLVLEVKGDCEDLPVPLRRVGNGMLKKAAFSKYYECFKLLSGYDQ